MLKKKYFAFILSFFVLLEIGLRLTGIFQVYSEKIGGEYRSYWGFEHVGYYKLLPKNKRMKFEQKEFKVDYSTNGFGMRNPEISSLPKDSTIRILCLGDSFTQGDGASNGNSYPRQLERILNGNESTRNFEIVNAGSNGSDIIYSEKLFIDIAHHLKPQLVLVLINDSDIEDLIIRGGLERFKDDNRTQFNDGPWYEKLYAKSHVIRFVVHGVLQKSFLFLNQKAEKKEIEIANKEIMESMNRLSNFCSQKEIEIYFIIHPYPNDTQTNGKRKQSNSKINIDDFSNGSVFDLNAYLRDTLSQLPYESYAWPLNGHFNDNGYKIMTEEIYKNLIEESSIIKK